MKAPLEKTNHNSLSSLFKGTTEAFKTFWKAFREALKGSGLWWSKRHPVELWKWETMEDEDVCEDCLMRASWPPMDIADWMKEGLPGTPEAETECGPNCRCRLVPYKIAKEMTRK